MSVLTAQATGPAVSKDAHDFRKLSAGVQLMAAGGRGSWLCPEADFPVLNAKTRCPRGRFSSSLWVGGWGATPERPCSCLAQKSGEGSLLLFPASHPFLLSFGFIIQ